MNKRKQEETKQDLEEMYEEEEYIQETNEEINESSEELKQTKESKDYINKINEIKSKTLKNLNRPIFLVFNYDEKDRIIIFEPNMSLSMLYQRIRLITNQYITALDLDIKVEINKENHLQTQLELESLLYCIQISSEENLSNLKFILSFNEHYCTRLEQEEEKKKKEKEKLINRKKKIEKKKEETKNN